MESLLSHRKYCQALETKCVFALNGKCTGYGISCAEALELSGTLKK